MMMEEGGLGVGKQLQQLLQQQGLTVSMVHPHKGRSLFTTRDFYPGEVILCEEPYVCVPSKTLKELKCDWCFVSGNLKRCSSCQLACYCGSSCQKSDWKLHRLECQALLKLDKDRLRSLTPTIRLMVKLYLRRKLESEKVIPVTAMDNYNLVEALVSHICEVNEKQLVLYAQMANLVNLILQWPGMNIKEIAENFSKLACNAHTICDSEFRSLGTGLFPIISIINHSCIPTSVLVFEGRKAVIRAVQHIPKGTEVLISYIDTAGCTMTRQKSLKEQYFFTCNCPRCIKVGQWEDIQESALLEGYRCVADGCSGFLLRDPGNKSFICQQCGHIREKEELSKISGDIKLLSKKASVSLSYGYIKEACDGYLMVENLQVKICHPFSIILMQTRETLLKIFMDLQDWKQALARCRLTITVYERVYPGFHPLRGLQYYTCGKLEWLLGYTEDAMKSLGKAVDILRITHGSSSPFMKELLMKLDEARAEASFLATSNQIH